MKREPDVAVDWTSVEHDLDIVRSTRSNLVIIGPDLLVTDVLRSVIAAAQYSIIVSACDPRPLRLPAVPLPGATLVLRDIDKLDADDQAPTASSRSSARDRDCCCRSLRAGRSIPGCITVSIASAST